MENKKAVIECLEILISLDSVKEIDFIGSGQSRAFRLDWQAKFEDVGKKIKLFEEGEEDDEDEEEAASEEDENNDYESDLLELSQKLE